ncbi:hypothetical protein [Streptomyces sp. V2]|uniref:Secreted protein n=1 Tax=Streptomyces niveiscabiei TaxID=164115 RepID=A0ABW9I965_9ACTN|nr:hypothetical protein [Streptomyces sp. V2]
MSRLVRKAAVGLLAVCGAVGLANAPASAADYPTDHFVVGNDSGRTYGDITWYNRTANITGTVADHTSGGYTTAYFEAFAGSTKIDSVTRSANDESDLGEWRGFNFTIGDTDLTGGIDRIKVTVCRHYSSGSDVCSAPENYSKS